MLENKWECSTETQAFDTLLRYIKDEVERVVKNQCTNVVEIYPMLCLLSGSTFALLLDQAREHTPEGHSSENPVCRLNEIRGKLYSATAKSFDLNLNDYKTHEVRNACYSRMPKEPLSDNGLFHKQQEQKQQEQKQQEQIVFEVNTRL